MNLTPELVSDILVRQGFLKPEQGEAIKQEARALPRSMRNANAFTRAQAVRPDAPAARVVYA